ncbi:MAG: response regulator, partial [Pseudobdellovibrionaceae bacterium]|nr:response regulator [Pseudobdellovibrionaceae bacterium]
RFFDFIVSAKRDASGLIDGVMILGADVTEQLQARIAAEASSASKSAFLANMSHEIRTPLGAILGFSDLLKDDNLSAEERDRYIDTINRNSKALTQIIDDILDLAKIEANRLDVEEVNFSLFDLMHEAIELFKEKAKQKCIELTLAFDGKVPRFICSDPTRLRQIVFNIIGNAIKFTDVGGVHIQVRLLDQTDGSLRIAIDVKDTGRGIGTIQKQKLFQPFTQADNTTTRQFGGTGLGLALSKRLCEALGGSIDIMESELTKGSHFMISFLASCIPTVDKPAATSRLQKPMASEDLKLKDLHVLVVDDMVDNQILLKRYLTRNGATVDFASDGSEGVEKALNQTHDLVLMDIQMPRMDGYQAIRALHAQGYKKPVVALTAHALLEERRRTAAAGFAGHLTKPFNKDELVETVSHLAKGGASTGLHGVHPGC